MRALAGGLTFIAVAILVLSWDAAEPRAPAPRDPSHAMGNASALSATPAIAVQRAPEARIFEASRSDETGSAGTRGENPGRAARWAGRAVTSIGERAKPEKPRAAAAKPTPDDKTDPGLIAAIGAEQSTDTMASVARLYFAYFNRAPDFEGFNYYIGQRHDGRPLEAIANEFAGSREFELRYGSADNAAFIERIHRNVIGMPADPAQHAFWLAQLDAGTMTRGELMLAFSESDRYLALVGDEVFVTLAYAETLRRAPAPGELLHWVSFLDAGHPRAAVIEGLRSSPSR